MSAPRMTRWVRFAGSPRLGIALMTVFALYAALASLPLFPSPGAPPDGARVTFRHLPWIDKAEGEYFAWWPSLVMLGGIVLNMTVSMLTRVERSWRKAPVFLTHAGVALLALGSAIYAAQKQEGEVLLEAPDAGEETGPAVTEMLDKLRAAVYVHQPGTGTERFIEPRRNTWGLWAGALPRFSPWADDDPIWNLNPLTAQDGAWHLAVDGYQPARQTPPPDDRAGSSLIVHEYSDSLVPLNECRVPFQRHGAQPTRCATSRAPACDLVFGPLRVPMPGVSLSLRDVTIEMVPGTDTPRRVSALVRTGAGDDRLITLNQPLTVNGWTFSIAGWDQDGWLLSREAMIAGMGDRPRAGFIILGVGTSPGIEVIALGAACIVIGSGLALLISSRSGARAGVVIALSAALIGAPRRADAAPDVQIDPLSSLRTVPVQWNGRIAPLDTVARDVVRAMSGRERVPVPGSGGQTEDPLVTLLSLLLDLESARARPLLEAGAAPGARAVADRCGLLTPDATEHVLRDAAHGTNTSGSSSGAVGAVAALAERLALSRLDWRSVRVLAPPRAGGAAADVEWLSLDDPGAPRQIVSARDALADAWSAHDPARVHRAAVLLSESLREANSGAYEPSAVWIEALVNAISPLSMASWVYALAAALALLAVVMRGWERAPLVGGASGWVFTLALVIHTAGFGARWWIAGRLPITNQYESMLGLSLAACAAAGAWAVLSHDKGRTLGLLAASSLIGFGVLGIAHRAPVPGITVEPEAAVLGNAALLKYHVGTVLAAYAFIALGGVLGAAWLLARARPGAREALEPPLRSLLRLSFWTLTLGILLGALWADRSWGRWWAFDPKETWALITWLVYLAATHLGAGSGRTVTTRTLAWMHVLGTILMVWTWFGVNLLLPGLHAYAG